jgi:hypothetical protein
MQTTPTGPATGTATHAAGSCLPELKKQQPSSTSPLLHLITTILLLHCDYPTQPFSRIERALHTLLSLLRRTFLFFPDLIRRTLKMPSPGKRTFAEFTQEYAKAFPPSPPRFVGGWPEGGFTGVAAKRQKYQKDIEEAYKVATRHPDVDPTRYMPGAFPDGVLLPEMLEVPQIIAWSSVKLNQGANTAKNTYIKARNAYQKSRRAAAAARDVVIGVVGAMGTVKRQAVQVYTGLSNLQIVRRASRPPSSRVASPNRRQRSPRPSPSSSPSSLSGAGEPEPMQLDVEPSSHQVIETPLDASATGPSDGPSTDQAVEDSPPSSSGPSIDTSTLDVDETTSLHSSAGPSDSSSVHLSSETSSPISVAEPSNAASTHPATMIGSLISALTKPLELLHVLKANKKQKGGKKAKSASKAVGKKSHNHSGSFFTPKVAPGNKVAKPECKYSILIRHPLLLLILTQRTKGPLLVMFQSSSLSRSAGQLPMQLSTPPWSSLFPLSSPLLSSSRLPLLSKTCLTSQTHSKMKSKKTKSPPSLWSLSMNSRLHPQTKQSSHRLPPLLLRLTMVTSLSRCKKPAASWMKCPPHPRDTFTGTKARELVVPSVTHVS